MSAVRVALLDEEIGLVPAALLTPGARRRAASVVGALPAAFRWVLTEHRLRAGDDRVDLLAAATAVDGGRALAGLAEGDAARAGLSGFLPFFRAWASEGSLLRRDVEAVWLEYDLLHGEEGIPVPFVPFSVDPSYRRPVRQAVEPPGRVRAIVAEGLRVLHGQAWDEVILAEVERCAAALPEAGRVLHVAAAPRRGHRDLRLYVHMPAGDLEGWLSRIGWPGPRRGARAVLDAIGGDAGLVGAHVDVGERVRGAFAAERNLHVAEESEKARAVLGRLVAAGASSAPKAEAAAGSIGRVAWEPRGIDWPVTVQRDLCIKVIARDDAGIDAKVYLGFRPDFTLVGRPRAAVRDRPTAPRSPVPRSAPTAPAT